MCDEYPELKQEVYADVLQAADYMRQMEHNFIDKIFEQGDLDNLKAQDLKEFITKRTNEKLVELGYESEFKYAEEMASSLISLLVRFTICSLISSSLLSLLLYILLFICY